VKSDSRHFGTDAQARLVGTGTGAAEKSAVGDGSTPQAPDRFLEEWPEALRAAERQAIVDRRLKATWESQGEREPRVFPVGAVGVALSGGGIRSATLSLGFFQCLARQGILPFIDYLSTVSGGGYFGSFLGRWYMKRPAEGPGAQPGAQRVQEGLADPDSEPVKYLRENGRYLAPVGSGDGYLLAAVYLRNLVSIHIVLGLFALTLFALGATLRAVALDYAPAGHLFRSALLGLPDPGAWIWWSPSLWLAALVVCLFALPVGWAYWLVPGLSDGRWRRYCPHVATVVFLSLVLAYSPWGDEVKAALAWPPGAALLLWLAVRGPRRRIDTEAATRMRNRLSKLLRAGLVAAGLVLVYACVESLGQTLYAVAQHTGWKKALAAIVLPLLAAAIRYAAVFVGSSPKRKRFQVPLEWAAAAVALVLAVVILSLASAAAQGFAWGLGEPAGQPGLLLKWSAPAPVSAPLAGGPAGAPAPASGAPAVPPPPRDDGRVMGTKGLIGLSLLLIVFSLLMGQAASFLNHSSHHSFYSEHLTRAWLGASNPTRWKKEGKSISVPIPGDNIPFEDYRPHTEGGPLHLLNMTFNETVSGESQVEQRDRKGLSMAVSPFGISVGRRHHAQWCAPEGGRAGRALKGVWPERGFQVFPFDQTNTESQRLMLGYWSGISGAAFSTGMGQRTSAGVSFLLGLANVRLGYWWNSGIPPSAREGEATAPALHERLEAMLTAGLPVQLHLFNEFLGRFHGPARRRWYLSDGGHFENTGCYELLRRRVPLILCMDNGMDAGYTLGDIGELVRKARIDFGAEIVFEGDGERRRATLLEFMETGDRRAPFARDDEALKALVSVWAQGSLQDLRPGGERVSGGSEAAGEGCRALGLACSRAHAAVAFVYYPEPGAKGPSCGFQVETGAHEPRRPDSILLFVKSTLTGDEPLDLLTYKREHPMFPHESTADQFFDEAQWESYRKLGEHMAKTLFCGGPLEEGGDRP